jgi:hypothetical protein
MTRALASAVDRRAVRIGLVIIGVIVTVGLGPMAAFGTYAALAPLLEGQITDSSQFMASGIAGLAGVIGLVGAWCRVLLSTARFQTSPALLALTSAALGIGIAAAIAVFFVHSGGPYNLAAWSLIALAILGAILLAATLGARPNAT